MDYLFKVNEFEGPLDLLLHLIKDQDMDIMDIEIVSLTDQYLSYIKNMETVDLTVASEYLVMASELTYLKSKMLLPNSKEDLSEDLEFVEAKEDLVRRLLEYQQYKELTTSFKELEEKRMEMYTKAPNNLKEYRGDNIRLGEDVSLNDLLVAFSKFMERKNLEKPISTKITSRELSVEDRTMSIKKILRMRKRVEFIELFEEFSKPYVVVTFLSILEMAKKRELVIVQTNNFDKIYVEVA